MASDSSTDSPFHAKQIVFLFMAATVVAVVVFLCGVLVGRGVPIGGRGGTESAGLGTLTLDDLPPPTLSTPSSEPSAAATTSDDLTYPGRLSGGMESPERIRDAAPIDPVETADPDPAVDAPVPVDDAPEPEVTPVVDEPSDVVAPTPSDAADEEPVTPVIPAGAYVVQVIALRSPAAAQSVADGLVEKGFRAFVLQPFAGEPDTFYRVRVGPFSDEAEAERVRERLRTEEGLVPYITR